MSEASTLVLPELTLPELERVHPNTLGRLAVLEPLPGESRQIELGCVREQLRDMDHKPAELFDAFCQTAVPLDLQDDKRLEAPSDLWNVWLFRGTSDQQLLDFLKWNVDSVRQQQADDRFQEALDNERKLFKRGVGQGLAEGYLDTDFEAAIEGVDDLRVYVGDGFNTHAKGRAGYHRRGSQDVVIATARNILTEGFDNLYDITTWVAKHEFNHPFGSLGFRYMDEALTEHTAQVYEYGQPHIIRPNERRHNYHQAYAAERALVADFFGPIAVKFASLAYSQIHGRDRLDDFTGQANDFWSAYVPPNRTAFGQLNMRMRSLEQKYQLEGMMPSEAGTQAATETRNLLAKNPRAVFASQDNSEQFQRLLTQ